MNPIWTHPARAARIAAMMAAITLAFTLPAAAQDYPVKPIRFIVSTAVGTTVDSA